MLKIKLLPLILILFFALTVTGYCVTELDYMEYANDELAQTAYVSSEVDQQQTAFSQALISYGDWEGYTIRQLIANTNIDYDGYKVAVKFEARAADDALTVLDCFIGHKASSGDGWDFDGNQVRLTFNTGNDGFIIALGETITSDFVNFDLDNTKDFIISFATRDTKDFGGMNGNDGTGNTTYLKAGANEAGDTTPNSYTTDAGRTLSTSAIYVKEAVILQSYSESTIKEQGSYSLKGFAIITDSLNETLTLSSLAIDLTDQTQIKYDIRGSRTGSQIKIGIHDSGGTTSEHTANIASANTFQTETWDISGVLNANKDVIDSIIITIINANAGNTFYIDNMYAEEAVVEAAANIFFMFSNF